MVSCTRCAISVDRIGRAIDAVKGVATARDTGHLVLQHEVKQREQRVLMLGRSFIGRNPARSVSTIERGSACHRLPTSSP